MITRIHVNQHNIKANSKGADLPVLTVKDYKENRKTNHVKILDSVGDVLPSNGVFGFVKNIISSSDELSAEDKATALEELEESSRIFELEVKDRESARLREVEITKTGKFDFLFYLILKNYLLDVLHCNDK